MTPFAPTGPCDMITASTQLLAIVGTPIGLVRSPENFNRWFAQAGVDMAMFPADVDATRLGAFVELARGMRNLRGFIVTMPFKQAVARRASIAASRKNRTMVPTVSPATSGNTPATVAKGTTRMAVRRSSFLAGAIMRWTCSRGVG